MDSFAEQFIKHINKPSQKINVSRQRSLSPDKNFNFKTPMTSRKTKVEGIFLENKLTLTQSVDFRKKPAETDPYEFVKQLKKEDRVWFWNSHPDHLTE